MRSDPRTTKMRATITTVDPTQRLIQVQTVNGPLTVSVIEVPFGFVWPQEGEKWSIYKENQTWILGARLQQDTDPRRIEDLLPGQSLNPTYYEKRLPTGTLYSIIEHNLGSKVLTSRVRPAQVGYTLSLSTDITAGLTGALAAKESQSLGGGVRYTGSGFMMIDNEIISYASSTIGNPTATFSTLVRGQLGTSASAHKEGAQVTLFSSTGVLGAPTYTLDPIDNNRAILKFAATSTFPIDIALIG